MPNQHQALPSTFLTVAYGDGIGPEIMDAVLLILKEARLGNFLETVEIGQRYYENGVQHGISPDAFPKLTRTGILLKAPHVTPSGDFISPEEYLAERYGVVLQLTPLRSWSPLISSGYPERDILMIEAQSRLPEDEKLLRAAIQVAQRHGISRITWHTASDVPGWFSELQSAHPDMQLTVGDNPLAQRNHAFVTRHSPIDVAATARQVAGSPMLACTAYLAADFALFTPLHDANAPANPSALLHAACLMLLHLGRGEEAAMIENAWVKTLEDGIATDDLVLARQQGSVTCRQFAHGVADRLGEHPQTAKIAEYPLIAGLYN